MANRNGLLFNSADGYWVLRVVVLVLGQEIEILKRENKSFTAVAWEIADKI